MRNMGHQWFCFESIGYEERHIAVFNLKQEEKIEYHYFPSFETNSIRNKADSRVQSFLTLGTNRQGH